jgi:hypothetical protein
MGIETIKLTDGSTPQSGSALAPAPVKFAWHQVTDPALSIWNMTVAPDQPLFPWWNYAFSIDEDVKRLKDLWNITDAQSFFDCLFFSQFRKIMGSGIYMIFPGYLRTQSWGELSDSARSAFLRGQGCVYRLDGSYNGKMDVRWVPFAQPQSLVKDPSLEALWSLFVNGRTEDVSNSIGFFALNDARKLPRVISLLVQPNEQRSTELASIVDWYGVYSSPVSPGFGTSAVVYGQKKSSLALCATFEERFAGLVDAIRTALAADASPRVAFRFLSRLVAL